MKNLKYLFGIDISNNEITFYLLYFLQINFCSYYIDVYISFVRTKKVHITLHLFYQIKYKCLLITFDKIKFIYKFDNMNNTYLTNVEYHNITNKNYFKYMNKQYIKRFEY